MSASLDMSLDDIIARRKSAAAVGRGGGTAFRGRGSLSGPGPQRRLPPRYDPNRSTMPYPMHPPYPTHSPYPMQPARQLVEPMMVARNGGSDGEAGTKLYLSNLDYDVTSGDIEVLFSEVGELLKYTIHYDRSGGSKGTGEVIFKLQSDALAAVRRYDNARLDGKPMKIEIVGHDLVYPAPIPLVAASVPQNPHVAVRSRQGFVGARGHGRGVRSRGGMDQDRGFARGKDQDRGSARGKDQGRRRDRKLTTAEELDSELEKYQLEAMTVKRRHK